MLVCFVLMLMSYYFGWCPRPSFFPWGVLVPSHRHFPWGSRRYEPTSVVHLQQVQTCTRVDCALSICPSRIRQCVPTTNIVYLLLMWTPTHRSDVHGLDKLPSVNCWTVMLLTAHCPSAHAKSTESHAENVINSMQSKQRINWL